MPNNMNRKKKDLQYQQDSEKQSPTRIVHWIGEYLTHVKYPSPQHYCYHPEDMTTR